MSDEMGCLDSFCYLKGKAKGMHTNGGCRCVRNLVGRDNPAAGFAIEKRLSELHNIIESLHTQLVASEARVAELENTRPASGELVEQIKEYKKHHQSQLPSFAKNTALVVLLDRAIAALTQPGKVSVSRECAEKALVAVRFKTDRLIESHGPDHLSKTIKELEKALQGGEQ